MPERVALRKIEDPNTTKFFSTGCTLLDCINNGGWPIGRMNHLIGDSSSGKSLLAIEACANFAMTFGENAAIRYNETEAAFEREYAYSIGLPVQATQFVDTDGLGVGSPTIEHFGQDLLSFLNSRSENDLPCMYVLDVLATQISDEAEEERELGEKATYGTGKAKFLSEFFRKHIGDIYKKKCCLIFISQVRDNLTAMYGDKKTYSGGKGIKFYSTTQNWLIIKDSITHQITNVKRITGSRVIVKNSKNKVGPGYGTAEVDIMFMYGVDDAASNINWLKKNNLGAGSTKLAVAFADYPKLIDDARDKRNLDDFRLYAGHLREAVIARWNEVSEALKPTMPKY